MHNKSLSVKTRYLNRSVVTGTLIDPEILWVQQNPLVLWPHFSADFFFGEEEQLPALNSPHIAARQDSHIVHKSAASTRGDTSRRNQGEEELGVPSSRTKRFNFQIIQ